MEFSHSFPLVTFAVPTRNRSLGLGESPPVCPSCASAIACIALTYGVEIKIINTPVDNPILIYQSPTDAAPLFFQKYSHSFLLRLVLANTFSFYICTHNTFLEGCGGGEGGGDRTGLGATDASVHYP